MQTRTLRIGHSPDPDDAFMWYPLADLDGQGPKVNTSPYRFEHVLQDIETLNQRSARGELEITALSIHQFAFVADKYALTSCGSSMGDGYGPMIVSRKPLALEDLSRVRLAVPGKRTTAFLAAALLYKSLGLELRDYSVVMFDEIIGRVAGGEFDAGLIIHEGQLTYAEAGLHCTIDLGKWWTESRGLPLPLGGNAIRRDLAAEFEPICSILYESIRYALAHREEAVNYALNYARDMGVELADKFVGMYVNDWTLDYGPVGRQAVKQLLAEGAAAGLLPEQADLELIAPR